MKPGEPQCLPLAGLRVLELAGSLTAAYCCRILADLGARVHRSAEPAGDTRSDGEAALSAWLHRGKSSRPLHAPDLVVADEAGEARALEAASARAGERAAVLVISHFGLRGPLAGTPATELTVQHAAGLAWHQAMPVSSPRSTGPRASAEREAAMAAGVGAALAGLWAVLVPGKPRTVDFSLHDFISHLLIEPVAQWREGDGRGTRLRAPGQAVAIAGGLVWLLPCSDGFVMISPREEHQWQRWLDVLGHPAWSTDTALCGSRDARAAHSAELQQLMAAWSRERTRQDVFDAAQSGRIACFPVSEPADLLANAQLAHRRFFDEVRLGQGRVIRMPGLPFLMHDSAGARLPKGRDWQAGESCAPAAEGGWCASRSPGDDALAGVRVLDFSWVMAGPLCTKMLAAMGAEVIKIETSKRPEFASRGGWFDVLNNSKRSCSIDIATPEGQQLVRRLVQGSHVLVENFSAGVMRKHGLGQEELCALRPELVYASASGVGRTGPQSSALAYGTLLQAYSGRAAMVGAPNPALEAMGILPAWTDPVTALWEALAIVSAVAACRRTGRGAYIDLSMLEATVALLPQSLLAAQQAGAAPQGINREDGSAPAGCFACAGDDEWLALSVRTEAHWQGLCSALQLQEAERTGELASYASRAANRDRLEALIAARLRSLSAEEAEAALRAAGVPASRSLSVGELLRQPHLRERGQFPSTAPGTRTIALPWVDQHGWRGRIDPAPALGRDNEYVLGELLGLSSREIARLAERGVVR